VIVCLCRRVSDRTIAAAIEAGARTLKEISLATGAGTGCGCCLGDIEARLEAVGAPRCSSTPCAGCPRARAATPRRGAGGAEAPAAAQNGATPPARAVA
jgi:bacterioferritin-associated ferredoxin